MGGIEMKRILFTILFIGILLLSACGTSTPISPVGEQLPAEFIVSNLQIIEPQGDETFYGITVNVENIGDTQGIHELIPKVNGVEIENGIVEVELNPGEKNTITLEYLEILMEFIATGYQSDGTGGKEHTISIGGLSQTIIFPEPSQPEPSQPDYALQLLSSSSERAYGYITRSGEVKNISDSSLENVMAVVSYYTEDDTFVKSADALIDYNPILSGQTSPFSVITTDNPAITKLRISFKYLFGGTISYEDKR